MSQKQWGGRFCEDVAEVMQRFTESVSYDWRLYAEDIEGSVAHARMLERVGILTSAEAEAIVKGLEEIRIEIESGRFHWRVDLEDVHMNIEAALTERVPAGAKLHTGRSRNDQVATDMRLWLKRAVRRQMDAVRQWQQALVKRAEQDLDVIVPGYTHLQRGQPVRMAHHWLAYVEMAERDYGRLADAMRRMDVLPLGSGALAGSTLNLDREWVRDTLGFAELSRNSMDAVSDRDFIVEYLGAAALMAVHFSRLAEDLILWSSSEYGFIRISDGFTTGSSLMPQKKNPDAAELARGKTGRVVGNWVALVTLLKGLPMTYNRDLQEDKERLFDTVDTIDAVLAVLTPMLRVLEVKADACKAAASDPVLLATDVADWLVGRGMPFREAHHVVGRLVRVCEERGIGLDRLPLESWMEVSPLFSSEVIELFKLPDALEKRTMVGAPSRDRVMVEIHRWNEVLSSPRA